MATTQTALEDGRIKTLDDLIDTLIISQSDAAIDFIYSGTGTDASTVDGMVKIMKFLGEKDKNVGNSQGEYWTRRQLDEESVTNIGYRLIKDDMIKKSNLGDPEKRMFFDAVFGWIAYNEGTLHNARMNENSIKYINTYTINSYSRNLADVSNSLGMIKKQSHEAQSNLVAEFDGGKESAYLDLFSRSIPYFERRLETAKRQLTKG